MREIQPERVLGVVAREQLHRGDGLGRGEVEGGDQRPGQGGVLPDDQAAAVCRRDKVVFIGQNG